MRKPLAEDDTLRRASPGILRTSRPPDRNAPLPRSDWKHIPRYAALISIRPGEEKDKNKMDCVRLPLAVMAALSWINDPAACR